MTASNCLPNRSVADSFLVICIRIHASRQKSDYNFRPLTIGRANQRRIRDVIKAFKGCGTLVIEEKVDHFEISILSGTMEKSVSVVLD